MGILVIKLVVEKIKTKLKWGEKLLNAKYLIQTFVGEVKCPQRNMVS